MRILCLLIFLTMRIWAEDLLIQGALDTELGPLVAALEGKQVKHIGAWTFWTGRIGTQSVVISRTEMGPINAVAATTLGIVNFHPKAIINQGTAGAHNPKLQLWDIVVGEKATDYGAFQSSHGDAGAGMDSARWKPIIHKLRLDNQNLSDFPSFPGDFAMIEGALVTKYERGKVVKGHIGSAFEYNRELDRIQWIFKTYGTATEDMESAFAAGVATGMKVPFVAIRIISDSEWNHPTFERIAGEYGAQFVLDYVKAMK